MTPDKNGKSAPTQLVPPVPGQAYGLAATRTLSTSRSFQILLKHKTLRYIVCYRTYKGYMSKKRLGTPNLELHVSKFV